MWSNWLRVVQNDTEFWESSSFQRGSAALAWFSPACGLEEIGIEPQSGDHTDMAADRGEQIKSGEALETFSP